MGARTLGFIQEVMQEVTQKVMLTQRVWCHRDEKKVHFGQVGLLALPGWVTAPVLEQWMQEARDFAAEWTELRPLHQNKLCGRCLRAPLQVSFSAYGKGCIFLHAPLAAKVLWGSCLRALVWMGLELPLQCTGHGKYCTLDAVKAITGALKW